LQREEGSSTGHGVEPGQDESLRVHQDCFGAGGADIDPKKNPVTGAVPQGFIEIHFHVMKGACVF
jgi:hypothetical protein